jgi:hypothetical protein
MTAILTNSADTIPVPTIAQLLEYRVWLVELYQTYIDPEHGEMQDREAMHIVAQTNEPTKSVRARAEAKMQGWKVVQMWSLPRPDYDYEF